MEADSGDMILQGHRSWGPITDVRVILLNSSHEVSDAASPRMHQYTLRTFHEHIHHTAGCYSLQESCDFSGDG